MKMIEALKTIKFLATDSSIFIYYVEVHVAYMAKVDPFFERVSVGELDLITSSVTLTEVLVKPYKMRNMALVDSYNQLLLASLNVKIIGIDVDIADRAAQLRAKYNLRTPDAIQIATAIAAGADAFLTNDFQLKRVSDLPILILDDLEL